MKIEQFEGCPSGADKFVTGVGISVFDNKNPKGKPLHTIEVNVANAHSVNTGCGLSLIKDNDYGCLGAGSLELVVDGKKTVRSIDYGFEDKLGRVIAYNTVSLFDGQRAFMKCLTD